MPNFFGIANDLAYGQKNVGLRRFDIMNQLYSQKVQKSKTIHPGPAEWQEYELQFMSKWFSYEMDAYAFARKMLWAKNATAVGALSILDSKIAYGNFNTSHT